MKLNFWQIIGVGLLVIGLAWLAWRELSGKPNANPTSPTSQKSG